MILRYMRGIAALDRAQRLYKQSGANLCQPIKQLAGSFLLADGRFLSIDHVSGIHIMTQIHG